MTKCDLKLAVIVSFLNEAEHLPTLLASIAAQTQPPDQLLLVDDGSRDASGEIASTFADERSWARTLRRPVAPPAKDRLASAGELRAFLAGVEQLDEPWHVVAKLDADLELNPELFEAVRRRFASDPRLGITGSRLSVWQRDGSLRRERSPEGLAPGPSKFYRRQCYQQIVPLPPILGWDTIDVLRARQRGWRTERFALPSGESLHLRPTGSYDGRLLAYRRWGACAWGYGVHPLWLLLGGIRRMTEPPYIFAGLNYLFGWALAAARGYPRAEPAVRALARREELDTIRRRLWGRLRPGGREA
jgi:glycosyltransferase involved in cell wall biosynthesis